MADDVLNRPSRLAEALVHEPVGPLGRSGLPAFGAQSYPDLWDAWQDATDPIWLQNHLANLRVRYAIPFSR